MKGWLAAVAVSWAALLPAAAWPQSAANYPAKPVHLILPYAAGNSSDNAARILVEFLTPALGQPVVLDNRPGAGQNIGTQAAINSAPDGYTLLMASEVILVEHLLDKSLAFVAPRDLAPVARVAGGGTALSVPGNFPANNLKEFVSVVKASPGKYNYALIGNFELPEMVDFRDRLGLQMVLVPYKSAPESNQAVITGEAHMVANTPGTALPFVQQGKMKVLAYTGLTPHYLMPNVPTVAASGVGLDNFEAIFAFTIFVPVKTSPDIVNKLHPIIVDIVKRPEVIKRYHDIGYDTYTPTLPELKEALAARIKRTEGMLARGLKLR